MAQKRVKSVPSISGQPQALPKRIHGPQTAAKSDNGPIDGALILRRTFLKKIQL